MQFEQMLHDKIFYNIKAAITGRKCTAKA